MRDSQRSKVYAAEEAVFGVSKIEFESVADVQAFVDKVLSSKVLQRHHPRARLPLKVTDGRSRRRGGFRSGRNRDQIMVPRRTRSKWYVLHEIAHHLAHDRSEASHGWRFCAIYLDLVRAYMGRGYEEKLKAEFKARKIKFRQPRKRQMSSEQREAARQRMLSYHATRKENV